MKKVLVIYHSQSGNTEAMAKAIAEGAGAAGAAVVLKRADDANADDILNCDIVAVGTPNFFGYMAGMVKDFFDRAWATIKDKVGGKPYVTFGSIGGGGTQSLDSVERICNGMNMRKAFDGVAATRKPSEEALAKCRELGRKLATADAAGKTETSPKVQEPRL